MQTISVSQQLIWGQWKCDEKFLTVLNYTQNFYKHCTSKCSLTIFTVLVEDIGEEKLMVDGLE